MSAADDLDCPPDLLPWDGRRRDGKVLTICCTCGRALAVWPHRPENVGFLLGVRGGVRVRWVPHPVEALSLSCPHCRSRWYVTEVAIAWAAHHLKADGRSEGTTSVPKLARDRRVDCPIDTIGRRP